MTKEHAYSILGITPSATDDEIRRAWRKLALQYHPDKNPGNKAAEDKIKQVNEAYRTLKQKNAPGAERFTSNVDDWYDAVLMSMLNKAIDSMKTSGHPNSLFTFIDILNHMQNKNIDAETQKKIEQLKQIAGTLKQLNKYVRWAYLGELVATLSMMAHNLIFDIETHASVGLFVYPAMMLLLIGTTFVQDNIQKKTIKTADLARDIAQKVR